MQCSAVQCKAVFLRVVQSSISHLGAMLHPCSPYLTTLNSLTAVTRRWKVRVDWHEEGGMGRERAKEVPRIQQTKIRYKLDDNGQQYKFYGL